MSPGSSEPSPSGNEHMRPRNSCLVLGLSHVGGTSYHVSSQVGFFVLLEALEIIQHTRARILDVLFGHFQRLLQLKLGISLGIIVKLYTIVHIPESNFLSSCRSGPDGFVRDLHPQTRE